MTYAAPNRDNHTLDENFAAPLVALEQQYGQATADLGMLDYLPLEFQQLILVHLDIRTLVNFRYANRRAATVVGSLSQYRIIVRHSHDALRGLLAIKAGK